MSLDSNLHQNSVLYWRRFSFTVGVFYKCNEIIIMKIVAELWSRSTIRLNRNIHEHNQISGTKHLDWSGFKKRKDGKLGFTNVMGVKKQTWSQSVLIRIWICRYKVWNFTFQRLESWEDGRQNNLQMSIPGLYMALLEQEKQTHVMMPREGRRIRVLSMHYKQKTWKKVQDIVMCLCLKTQSKESETTRTCRTISGIKECRRSCCCCWWWWWALKHNLACRLMDQRMKQEVPCRLEVGKWWKLLNSCLCCECVAERLTSALV